MRFRRLLILPTIATLLVLHSVVVYAEAPTPDIPEVNGFVPTQMADVEEPHPFTNRVIVAEPVANAYGTAEITYPIDLPAGRNGLQPNIDLTYSSSNGASVFGYGWTMQQPAITIDTRWGVPRYDRQYETEIYTLNGTQIVQKDGNPNLTLPYQTHIQQQRRNGNVAYMSRDTKNKDVIIRHGNSPRNYWWSVIDRNGTTYYYGKYQADDMVNDSCILKDEMGNIGYWALAEVVDVHGNYMRYEYEKGNGTDLFLDYIYYTGHRNTQGEIDLPPTYRIRLHYDYNYYDRLQSDCRLGLIRTIDRTVCYIDESYFGQSESIYKPFVRYSLRIENSQSDNKPLLQYITQYQMPESLHGGCYWMAEDNCYVTIECGDGGLMLSRSCFTYYGDTDIFESEEHVIEDYNESHNTLHESRSTEWSLGGTLTVGVGPDAWITNISAGGNYDFSKSKGDVDMTLMDINGDGLADKVYIKNDSIYYRKQVFSDTISFFSTEQNTGIPAKSLNHDVSKTHQWGLQAGAAVPGEVAGANISGGWSITDTQTSSYFADVNGDGLPDYIDNGTIYFNTLKYSDHFIKHNGEYLIQTDTSDCSSYFYYDGSVVLGQDCYVDYVLVDSFSVNPDTLHDHCENCELLSRLYLYGGDDYSYLWWEAAECSRYCNMDLACREWEWYSDNDDLVERCEQYQDLCSRCLWSYLHYGEESEEYQSCRDYFCIFKGQRMVCDTCRERCIEDSVDCEACIEENCAYIEMYDDNEGRTVYYVYGVPVCEDCIPYCQDNLDSEECYWCRRDYCNLVQCDPEYGGYCYNGMEICTECQDRCNDWSYPEDCNQCKRENRCNGYIPEDLFAEYLAAFYDNYIRDDMAALIEQLQERGVICEACRTTCRNDPAKCIPCLHKYCNYRAEEDIVNELVYEQEREYLQSHPKAYFVQDYNKVYVYDTITVCRENESIDPNIESVRVWVAPKNGTIRIKSHVQLMEDVSLFRHQSRGADGVRCVIQHDKQVQVVTTSPKHLVPTASDIIATLNIPANDYSMHSGEYANIVVHKGDVLSFHVMSRTTHDFDNVNWTQQIHYITAGDSYHSSNDYICSSKETFEYDELGEATIEYWADVQSGGNAVVNIMRGDNVLNSYIVTQTLNTHVVKNIFNIRPDKDNVLHLSLFSVDPAKVKVRAKVTFRFGDNHSKSVTKWLVPDVSFTQNNDEIYNDVYYNLFGPLYRGWGQYAFNNRSGGAIIPLDSLYNPYAKIYEENHNDTASYRANIKIMAEMDTLTLMESPDSMEEAFHQLGLYNPLELSWIEMRADAENYQWEAYGRVARVGQNIMSNTRNEAQQIAAANASPIADEEFDYYDNDVPVAINGGRSMSVRKESKTKQWNLSFGANIGGLAGIGRAKSKGTYKLQTDYMDMNGDWYPDIVREQTIQYTKPWGGLGETRAVDAYLHETNTITEGCSFSGNFGKTVKLSGGVKNDRFMTSISGSSGFGVSSSNNEASFILQDVNTDGLPDKLVISGDSVYIYLNLGYNFSLYKTIPQIGNLSKTYSESASGNVGFSTAPSWGEAVEQLFNAGEAINDNASMYQASISAGCSSSTSTNTTYTRLVDVNGNGRLDLVERTAGGFKITYNIFNRGNYGQPVVNNAIIQQSNSSNAGFNVALTGGYTFFGVMKVCAGVQTTPISISQTFGTHDLIDMNGDGLPDLVRVANNKIYVRYNTSGKTGLLKSIKTLNGKRIDLDYTLSQPTSGQPYRQMLLTSVRNIDENATADTGVPVMEKRIEYADPHYDPSERQSYGYGSVTMYDMYPATNDDTAHIYRKHIQRFQNQVYAEHGKLIYEAITDSADNLFTEYELGTIYLDAAGNETDNICQDVKIRVGKEAHYTRFYEGTGSPVVTAKLYDYDKYHNIIKYEDLGDTLITNDDLLITTAYENRSQYISKNLISLPITTIHKSAEHDIRRTRSEYTSRGKLSKQVYASLVNGNDSSATDYTYNDFGMLSHISLPCNHSNQRGSLDFVYDSLTQSMPISIANHFGQTQKYTYSPMWQQPLSIISPAGDTIIYTYDNYGRLTTITAPLERLAGRHTIEYSYGTVNYDYIHLYVDTKTYTEGDSTLQRSLYDSRGLLLQRQKRRASGFVVTDRNAYDCFGRVVETYSPTTANNLSNSYISQNRQLVASYTYDILDRQTSVQWNDNNHNVSIIQYLLGNDYWGIKRFKTITTDENGGQWQTFTSPQGWVTTTIAPDNATTRFAYDALGQLISSTDADGLTTTHTYNGLGRRIQRNHPDAGVNRWWYDPAGNITATQRQSQTTFNMQTTYHYKYDRLDSICYPLHPEMNVAYMYDSVSGRLLQRTDLTGKELFKYDAMGNVTESRRQIIMPNETYAYTFLTKHKYDSFGKMLEITYPDGEVATYTYRDGLLKNMQGTHHGRTKNYISDIAYNNYDKPLSITYGNGVIKSMSYNPSRQWLTSSYIFKPDVIDLEDKSYTYDDVGNITQIAQDVRVGESILGGRYTTDYTYDTQNRLLTASQQSTSLGAYSYSMSYSPAGCVGQKQCAANLTNYTYGYRAASLGQHLNHQVAGIFDEYAQEMTRLNWDVDGQLSSVYGPCFDGLQQHRWDEAGRLVASYGNGTAGYFGYDGNGERVYKLRGTMTVEQINAGREHVSMLFTYPTLYVNPYMVITPQGYTKYYYMGTDHVAAQIGNVSHMQAQYTQSDTIAGLISKANTFMQSAIGTVDGYIASSNLLNSISGDPILEYRIPHCHSMLVRFISTSSLQNQLLPVISGDVSGIGNDLLEPALYYYHPDHLGSATWITDSVGNPAQYLHYLPYGELWKNQKLTGYDERYKYTGKERDNETGYDYFGARHYTSSFSGWLSPDPLMDKYPGISPYAYCNWNPLKYVDPTGRLAETIWDVANVIIDFTSLISNIKMGNTTDAIIDGAGLILDAVAVALPFVPGGAGAAIQSTRAAKFIENTKRGVQNEQKVLKEMNLIKNTKTIQTVTNNKDAIRVIPDAIKDGTMYEIKDAKAVYNTKQIQGERHAAKELNLDYKIITGEGTHVSSKIPKDEIIKRNDIGP